MKRREFVKNMTIAGTTIAVMPAFASGNLIHTPENNSASARNAGSKDGVIRIGLIGHGNMGREDTNAALACKDIKLVAVCDLYDLRLESAKKEWGDDLFLTKDYLELLKRPEIDAVLIATPDHWHKQIIIDALKAGKHVFCQKPLIHKLDDANDLLVARRRSNKIIQVGSQGVASLGNQKAKQLLQSGIIGNLTHVSGAFTKYLGFHTIPEDATEKTIWWDRFLGNAPKIPFDAMRFLHWRGFEEYSTGIAGDLFVHVISSMHYITDAIGPEMIYSTGDILHYKGGVQRTSPDIMLGTFRYPQHNGIGPFYLTLTANLSDGVSKEWSSTNFRLTGDKGVIEVGWDWVKFKTNDTIDPSAFEKLPALGYGIDTPKQVNFKKEKKDGYFMGYSSFEKEPTNDFLFQVTEEYEGGHINHLKNFFTGIRNNTPVQSDLLFGLRAAAPAILSNNSNHSGEPIAWDPEKLKIVKKKIRFKS